MWRSNSSRVLDRDAENISSFSSSSADNCPKQKTLYSLMGRQSKLILSRRKHTETGRNSKGGSSESSGCHENLSKYSRSSNLAPTSERLEIYNLTLRPAPGKGLGLFTTEDIPKGKTLIAERPALVWAPVYGELTKKKHASPEQSWDSIKSNYLQNEPDKLPKRKQGEIWSLYNYAENSKECPLLSIFRTNTFGFSEHENLTGIYIFCARLNHCCDPNCTWNISEKPESNDSRDRVIKVTAIKDIKAGEELTIAYILRENRVEERQAELLRAYGFRCACPRCIFELRNLEKLYTWPYDGKQKARLRFKPIRPRHTSRDGQGWDFLTVIEHISGDVTAIDKGDIITREAPLILFNENEVGKMSSFWISEIFYQLSSSRRKAYLRLYSWQLKPSAPEILEVHSWPSYDLESTDEEVCTGKSSLAHKVDSRIGKRPEPRPKKLLDIWNANSLHLDDGVQAVFSFACHINHSCSPSCRIVWCKKQKFLNLVATRPLKIGDQITICYNSDIIYHLAVKERQSYLKEHYGFDCTCFRCYIDLSGVNNFELNIDQLPLSEILAAGDDIDYGYNENRCDAELLGTRNGMLRTPLEGLRTSLRSNKQDKTCRQITPNEVIVARHLGYHGESLPISQDLMVLWGDENKTPTEEVYPTCQTEMQ